jgi:AcrR family transcriptional regulator
VATDAPQRRRTQAERTAATTGALLDAARALFADDGYAATSLEAVVARAGVTKGALYHHFAGKEELFAAVFDREQQRLTDAAGAAYALADGPAAAIEAACLAFLDAERDPAVQRLTLLDAPLALSATTLRSTPLLGLLERGLAAAAPGRDAAALAQLLHGAIREAALALAVHPGRRDAVVAEVRALLRGFTG